MSQTVSTSQFISAYAAITEKETTKRSVATLRIIFSNKFGHESSNIIYNKKNRNKDKHTRSDRVIEILFSIRVPSPSFSFPFSISFSSL